MGLDGRFRNAHDYAVTRGYFSGYPNFHETNHGAGVVYGTMLVHAGSAEWRDVPRTTYNVFHIDDVPAMFRAAASYASSQGFRAGMPTFHQADHGAGVVYGTILFGDAVDTQDVRRANLGSPQIGDVPAMMRAANDYAVALGYAGGFPTFHQRDAGGSTGVVYGIVLHKPGTLSHHDVPVDWMSLFPRPADGLLFQEQGRPEIYWIRDGARLHVPNPYVMEALGLDWNAVRTVPQGSLDHVPRDESWAPLGGRTPGSAVFVPFDVGALWNAGKVYWPLRLATTKRHVGWGQEVRTIELRGWIGPPGGPNAVDPDFSYDLELDVGWVLSRGIDLSALVRVGNILGLGRPVPGITDPRAWCSVPFIKMEISGFPPKGQRQRKHPPDWTLEIPGVVLTADDAGAAAGQPVRWPFDPAAPVPANAPIAGGEYVRVLGSVVSDKAHPPEADPPMKDAVLRWRTGLGNNEHDDARWTEIHPPDWIEVVPGRPQNQFLRGVAVVAPGTFPWRAQIETVLDADIEAPQRPSPTAVLRYREFVGPETGFDTILEGNATKTGAAITPLASPDGIRLHVKVGGRRSFVGGSDGKFRALYWLYWEEPGPGPTPPGPPVGAGPHHVTCASKRRVRRLTSIASIGGVNADGTRWELSREVAIQAIDAGTEFYVELDGAARVRIVVARRFFRRYLKTRGDSVRSNNLLRLPAC